MDYHSPDRTYKKSRFRRELERSVSRRLVTSLLLGCLLFLVAIAAVNTLNQNARREDHLAGVARYLPRGVQRHGGVPAGRGPHRAVPLRPAEGSGQSALSHQPVQRLGPCGAPAHPDRLQGRGAVHDLLRGGDESAPAGVQPHRGGKRLPPHAGRLYHGLPLPGQQLGIRHDTPPLPGRRISGCGGGLSERERLDEAVQPIPVRRHPHQAQRRCHRLLERLLPLPEERQQIPPRRRGAVCEGGWEPLSAQQPARWKTARCWLIPSSTRPRTTIIFWWGCS